MKILKECYRLGLFKSGSWVSNIIAGMIVGVVALPLAMAFAIASGAKPEQGIYTAIVAGIMVSLFGGSRVQIAGPTGAFIVLLSAITAQYGMDGLQLVTLMAGVMLLLMGVCRLGVVMQYIPYPVILGFTAGIALVIWVGQLPSFFGLPVVTGHHFHEKLWHTLLLFNHLDMMTTLLASLGLFITLFVPKIPGLKRVPGPLVALIVVTLIQYVGQWPSVMTIGKAYGGIPSGLPHFHLPHWTWQQALTLIGPAFSVALLGAIESLLSAVVADGMAGTKHHPNQELIGQGLANIVVPFANGFAATGAIARTATNIRNGGTNPIAGVAHALTLVLVLLFLAPLAAHVPLAVLASVLFVVCWNMSELKHCIQLIKKAPRSDIAIMFITFVLTVFVDLVFAVQIGVLFAILYFFFRMANSLDVELHELQELAPNTENATESKDGIVFKLQGPIFFGAVERLEQAMKLHKEDIKTIVIRFGWVPIMDITALRSLEKLIESWQAQNIIVKLSGLNPLITKRMERSGLLSKIGQHNIVSS
jgi:SulP family sulfate permease